MTDLDVPSATARQNQLLAAFPEEAFGRVLAEAELCTLELKDVLHEAGVPLTHVHFPITAVVSLLIPTRRGKVEVATVGREGIVGVSVFLGGTESLTFAEAQVGGESLRLPAALLRELSEESAGVRDVLGRFTQALIALMEQSVACNRLHAVEERCARWLLVTRDRVGSDSFPVTQQFLAQMLGVRRASVTVAAGLLQKRGLIRYTRGRVTIQDGPGLEQASCECYGVVAERYRRLLPAGAGAGAAVEAGIGVTEQGVGSAGG